MGDSSKDVKMEETEEEDVKMMDTLMAEEENSRLPLSQSSVMLAAVEERKTMEAAGIENNPYAERYPPFPEIGSLLLEHYYCLGRLGKGTFCSIHRCVDLSSTSKHRMLAAKVELSAFANSGVLDGEASILRYLSDATAPGTVPDFLGHIKTAQGCAAVLMEYLPGEDMHQVRDRHAGSQRRLSVRDSVYLTADVMLPLLKNLHDVGVIHRDVKPSNCVRADTTSADRTFRWVDFGLSKSIVVPKDSSYADLNHPWTGKTWHRPPNDESMTTIGCQRKERDKADFRGTSMYASPRVHQLHDFARRDDMWSLMYVFCDLVTGGLPWMSYAANRDREACRVLKEQIHGLGEDKQDDDTAQMLMGGEYYLAKYKRDMAMKEMKDGAPLDESNFPQLVEPLPLVKDARKARLLRDAFAHLASLSFTDSPDYELLRRCISGFLDDLPEKEDISPVDWDFIPSNKSRKKRKLEEAMEERNVPTWELVNQPDPLEDVVLEEVEQERQANYKAGISATGEGPPATLTSPEAHSFGRLPMAIQFAMTQMQYNARHTDTTPKDVALRDWMKCAFQVVYGKWDVSRYEGGGHRTENDGHKRELFLKMVEQCREGATAFNRFSSREYFGCQAREQQHEGKNGTSFPAMAKTKILVRDPRGDCGPLIALSRVDAGLRRLHDKEKKKTTAPPPTISFGNSPG